MDNITEKLDQILQNPGAMNQIMELAATLGMQTETPPQPEEISQAVESVRAFETRHDALVNALVPYLKPNRRARLERAVQIAQITQLAGLALGSRKDSSYV